MDFGYAKVAQLNRMFELMNSGKIEDGMIIVGTNNVSRTSEAEEDQWEEALVCFVTEL